MYFMKNKGSIKFIEDLLLHGSWSKEKRKVINNKSLFFADKEVCGLGMIVRPYKKAAQERNQKLHEKSPQIS